MNQPAGSTASTSASPQSWAVGGFTALLLLLHLLEPEFSVVDDYTSDYALGRFGWLMKAAFFCMAVGVGSVGLGLRARRLPGKRATLGWILVTLAGAAFVLVGIFNTDPRVSRRPQQQETFT